jgi:hypothetical protein
MSTREPPPLVSRVPTGAVWVPHDTDCCTLTRSRESLVLLLMAHAVVRAYVAARVHYGIEAPSHPPQPAPCPQAWLEHLWVRIRRMDYWNAQHIPTNAPARLFRWKAPGAQVGANLQKLDAALDTSPFSVRYYHRDRELLPLRFRTFVHSKAPSLVFTYAFFFPVLLLAPPPSCCLTCSSL